MRVASDLAASAPRASSPLPAAPAHTVTAAVLSAAFLSAAEGREAARPVHLLQLLVPPRRLLLADLVGALATRHG